MPHRYISRLPLRIQILAVRRTAFVCTVAVGAADVILGDGSKMPSKFSRATSARRFSNRPTEANVT